MRIPGVWIPMVVLMAAALPGCRPAERARPASGAREGPASVVVSQDTMRMVMGDSGVVTTTSVLTDTGEWAPPEPEPNDCRYVGTRPRPRYGDPGYGQPYDTAAMMAGVPFLCRLRPQGPEVRLVVGGRWSIPMGFQVFLPADAEHPVQTLAVDNDERATEGSDLLVGEDLNGDGWMDLYVYTFSGTGGQMSDVFRFVPATQRFVPDSALPGINVRRLAERGCVGTSHKMSAWSVTGADYCWRDGTWVKVRAYAQDPVPDGRLIRTFQERRGGELRVVRVDTVAVDEPWPPD